MFAHTKFRSHCDNIYLQNIFYPCQIQLKFEKMNKVEDLEIEMRVEFETLNAGVITFGDVWRYELCNVCSRRVVEDCELCNGHRNIEKYHQFTVDIRPGTNSGDRIRLANQGHQAPNMIQGDIIINVVGVERQEKSYDVIWRKCIDINVVEAKCGFRRRLNPESDFPVDIVHRGKECIADGEEMVVRGAGMPIRGTDRRANLYLKFRVNPIPKYGERLGGKTQELLSVPKAKVPLEAFDGHLIYYEDVIPHQRSKMNLHGARFAG